MSVADIDFVRKALGQVGNSGIPTADSVAANKAIAHLDDFLPNLNFSPTCWLATRRRLTRSCKMLGEIKGRQSAPTC